MSLLAIRNLRIRFRPDAAAAVDGIDLDLHQGEILALVGESGCGKSTTAASIMGLTPKGTARTGQGADGTWHYDVTTPARPAPVAVVADRPVLKVEDLCVDYVTARGRMRALDGANLTLWRGETLGVLGESGSGKSTLSRASRGGARSR